ncbi:hypothetical protein [Bradyrhizobium sp. USDA 241]|uniref:hypothetical protein n=1 Tax=Bradyrhizobium sp. USDA 241 TaxID=3377725 RepID=UPI003C77D143
MLDLSKPMQTRHGYPARLIFDKHRHAYGPLVFAILHPEGVEKLGYRDAEGRYPRAQSSVPEHLKGEYSSDWDVINAPTPQAMVIVTVKQGCVDVTQVPDGTVVKVMDYDIEGFEDEAIEDEHGKRCRIDFLGPAGLYHVWPFA